ncbi:ABC transporter substrate-binding protein [Nocardioides sp.]|jgi:peptide/nickel transport system substrate-binding protein|uniref:ABC transporter substrate-binding protein n=1 Tax=Nocardioides sp. TaxID=35761 RepID=UPI002F3FF2D4
MRHTPLLVLLAGSALALGACGGSGSSSDTGSEVDTGQLGNTGSGTDATATGPVTIDGAQKGGIVTVLTNTGLTTTIDPAEAYYLDTMSIDGQLITRSLTQYKYDPTSKQMVLVPDLATDLGQHNDDYTKWTFTIRDGVRFEDGSPVTAKNIAWAIQRCMDAETFPTGPCQYYSNVYFRGGSSYKGPYTAPNQKFTAVKVNGDKLTIFMDKPFPDMPYWGAFPANGPVPLGKASDPKTYKNHPLSTGPYMIKSFSPAKELVLQRNPHWDPKTDPARTAYPDGYDFKTQQPSEKIDQIVMSDSGSGQTTLTYDNLLAPDYQTMKEKSSDRLTLGGQPCTFYWGPDNRKITDKRIREALSWAYPYKNAILAGGDIPGVTAVPATNLMPSGIPGRTPYNVTGREPFQTDPAKAKELLQQANAMGYDITFLFRSDDPVSVKVKDAIVKALGQAGFKATPVPTTIANYVADRGKTTSDINVRSASWCSDWPSGSTWLPTVYADTDAEKTRSLGANYSVFSSKAVANQINQIQLLPLDQQPKAWNDLDKEVMTKYFPLFPTYYGGVVMAHGSQVKGMSDDSALGMPTWNTMWVGR